MTISEPWSTRSVAARVLPAASPAPLASGCPGLANPAQELGAHCRFGSSLARDVSEFAILLTAKR